MLGLVGSYLGIYFYLRVIQFLFMSAEAPAATGGVAGAPGAGREPPLPGDGVICVAVFPGWVIELALKAP